MSLAWVQVDEFTGWATRIFKNQKAALTNVENFVQQMDRALAVSQIRRQIFDRQEGVCINCPTMLTFSSGHLHEKIHRGQGGEISLENSEMLCADCHILGPRSIHGKERSPQFTKRTDWEPRTR
jgi:5-methylcytosine-specific restriction endonuclease McrA